MNNAYQSEAGNSVEATTNGIIAAYLQKPEDPNEQWLAIQALRAAGSSKLRDTDQLQRLGQTGTGHQSVPDPRTVRSILAPLGAGSCSMVLLSPRLRLFEGPWSDRLLHLAAHAAGPEGTVVVGVHPDRIAAKKGWLSRSSAERILGPATRTSHAGGHDFTVHVAPGDPRESAVSVLGFAAENLLNLVGAEISDQASYDHPHGATDASNADTLVSALNYSVVGAGYKAALLDHVIDYHDSRGAADTARTVRIGFAYRALRRLWGRGTARPNWSLNLQGRSLRILDLGGGPGLTLAELLMRRSARGECVSGVCVDPSSTNQALFEHLQRWLDRAPDPASAVAERMRFELRTMEDTTGGDEFDVVCIIGALLYVPREDVDAVLTGAWSRLAPGGLLIIHENMLHSSYIADYDKMFTDAELEQYLARLNAASRTYWSSGGTTQVIGPRRASVFRVLVKPK